MFLQEIRRMESDQTHTRFFKASTILRSSDPRVTNFKSDQRLGDGENQGFLRHIIRRYHSRNLEERHNFIKRHFSSYGIRRNHLK